ncbi:MAG: hypothetical protein ABJL99_18215 [Aliishimia sp.]
MFPPNFKLNRRAAADLRGRTKIGLASAVGWVMSKSAVQKPYPTTLAAHHFRTPSPCGQLEVYFKLSTSFLQHKLLIQRGFASFSTGKELSLNRTCLMSCDEAVKKPIKRGIEQCTSKHGSWSLQQAACLQHAGTRWQNKHLSEPVEELQQQLSLTENHSQGPLSVQQVTCCIVKQTLESATKKRSGFLIGKHEGLPWFVLNQARAFFSSIVRIYSKCGHRFITFDDKLISAAAGLRVDSQQVNGQSVPPQGQSTARFECDDSRGRRVSTLSELAVSHWKRCLPTGRFANLRNSRLFHPERDHLASLRPKFTKGPIHV